MRCVIFCPSRDGTSIQPSRDTNQEHVKDGQKEYQAWHEHYGKHGTHVSSLRYGAAGQEKSYRQTSCIAHENFRGMEIEYEKAKQRSSHRNQPKGHGTVAVSNQEQAACSDDADSSGKAIHVVQQIERISDT